MNLRAGYFSYNYKIFEWRNLSKNNRISVIIKADERFASLFSSVFVSVFSAKIIENKQKNKILLFIIII